MFFFQLLEVFLSDSVSIKKFFFSCSKLSFRVRYQFTVQLPSNANRLFWLCFKRNIQNFWFQWKKFYNLPGMPNVGTFANLSVGNYGIFIRFFVVLPAIRLKIRKFFLWFENFWLEKISNWRRRKKIPLKIQFCKISVYFWN